MTRKLKTEKAKHNKRETARAKPPDTWAEVFAELDAEDVRDGFLVERDTRAAEDRPA
jgi:hypothetical protein